MELELPESGRLTLDVSFGGNFFAMVKARDLRLSLRSASHSRLIHLGMQVKKALNEKLEVIHPSEPHIKRVELTEIYENPEPSRPFSRSAVVFGEGQLNRSPCGTGTSALMATSTAEASYRWGPSSLTRALSAPDSRESSSGRSGSGAMPRSSPS